MLSEYRHDLLEIGAPGRLLMADKLMRVLPADDRDLLKKANPILKDGVKINEVAVEECEKFMVSQMVGSRIAAVIVLGGGHDLSDNIPANCEYVRVTTQQYHHPAGLTCASSVDVCPCRRQGLAVVHLLDAVRSDASNLSTQRRLRSSLENEHLTPGRPPQKSATTRSTRYWRDEHQVLRNYYRAAA